MVLYGIIKAFGGRCNLLDPLPRLKNKAIEGEILSSELGKVKLF